MEDTIERSRSEKTAAYLSGAVAGYEPDPAKARLFKEMAEAAEEQAGILAARN
jgi:vacuolar iron transporter family protein